MTWQLLERHAGGLRRVEGSPDSFDGPGGALLWYRGAGMSLDRLGDDVFIVRADGARPCGSNVFRREIQHA